MQDLKLYPNFNLGTVEYIEDNTVTISKASYAPGIWAGTEQLEINIHTWYDQFKDSTKVISIDLVNRIIELEDTSIIQIGDILRLK